MRKQLIYKNEFNLFQRLIIDKQLLTKKKTKTQSYLLQTIVHIIKRRKAS